MGEDTVRRQGQERAEVWWMNRTVRKPRKEGVLDGKQLCAKAQRHGKTFFGTWRDLG